MNAKVIEVATAVVLQSIPKILETRRTVKVAKAQRELIEAAMENFKQGQTPAEPIRVECERLA